MLQLLAFVVGAELLVRVAEAELVVHQVLERLLVQRPEDLAHFDQLEVEEVQALR